MNTRRMLKNAGGALAAGGAIAAGGYAALVVLNRATYGNASRLADTVKDPVLDGFIPKPEVKEHHEIRMQAPADVVIAAAKSFELLTSPVIRAIFRARELALGGEPDTKSSSAPRRSPGSRRRRSGRFPRSSSASSANRAL